MELTNRFRKPQSQFHKPSCPTWRCQPLAGCAPARHALISEAASSRQLSRARPRSCIRSTRVRYT
eukprot:COSAG02_NODE_22_length_53020_cov_16.223125_36_plen_65_part_00